MVAFNVQFIDHNFSFTIKVEWIIPIVRYFSSQDPITEINKYNLLPQCP